MSDPKRDIADMVAHYIFSKPQGRVIRRETICEEFELTDRQLNSVLHLAKRRTKKLYPGYRIYWSQDGGFCTSQNPTSQEIANVLATHKQLTTLAENLMLDLEAEGIEDATVGIRNQIYDTLFGRTAAGIKKGITTIVNQQILAETAYLDE